MTQVVTQEQHSGLSKPCLTLSVSLALAGQGAALSPILKQLDFKTAKQMKGVRSGACLCY